jgi:hypothetical protein
MVIELFRGVKVSASLKIHKQHFPAILESTTKQKYYEDLKALEDHLKALKKKSLKALYGVAKANMLLKGKRSLPKLDESQQNEDENNDQADNGDEDDDDM